MTFYLNNSKIDVLNGATFSIKKDETLDSGKIELIFSDLKDTIKPMTDLRIEDSGETYNFVVISDVVSVASKKPTAYKHTIEFVQNTKKLSKIQVRNTQFSQPAKNSLKCGNNAIFINTGDTYMELAGKNVGKTYEYSMEVSSRHKVRSSYFKINTYYCKCTNNNPQSSDVYYNNKLQDTCPQLFISFDVYKDNVLLYTRSGNFNNGEISYSGINLENGVYTIKNVKVMRKTDSTYTNFDLFIVNISLVADVYYYTLYDVLDTLRKQIALQEIDMATISAPMLYLESVYDATSKNYKIYARITNTNNQKVIATYYSSGAINLSHTEINIDQYDSEKVYIGSTKSGTVIVYAYLENTARTQKSSTKSESINFDANIVSPNLYFIESAGSSGATGYKYQIYNPNAFAVNVYAKHWQYNENNKPIEYTKVATLDTKGSYDSAVFQQTKLYVECYFTKVEEETIESSKTNGYKFIPPITYDYNLYLTDTGKDGTYILKDSQQFQSSEDYSTTSQCWRYIENNDLYDISDFALNTSKSDYDGKHFNLYGYKTITILPPDIEIRYSYNVSSSGYDIYVQFTNNNGVSCNVYYYAEGSITKVHTLVGNLTIGESKEILLGTVTTTSSGKITAYCSYETITSEKGEKSWSQSGGTVAPLIEYEQYGNVYTYAFTIKDLNTPRADLYYRYKFLEDWSNWIATANAQVQLTLSNPYTNAKTAYVEAYSSYEGIKSTTTAESVSIDGMPILAPTINVSQYGSYSKQISITTNATQGGLTTYYKIWKNGVMPSTWTEYGGSFVLSASAGSTDSYTIYAKTTSSAAGGESDTVSVSFTIEGAPITYELTVRHYTAGVFYTLDTYYITSGSTVDVSSYIKSISGYRFSYSSPGSDFKMTGDANLYIYYLAIVHDYQFSNNVTWSNWEKVVEIDQGTTTTYYYYLKSSSTSTYSSTATYEKYDRNQYVEDITLSCSVNKTTGVVSGSTEHNNAKSIVVDYGS